MNAPSSAAAFRYLDLLEPVDADAPTGPDLEYDPDFVMLLADAAPRIEAQYGNFVEVPPAANWAEIERACRALLLRTKDIRVAVILLRCRMRIDGAAGLRDGLALLKALLERYGETLHPLPVFEGERDPAMYANAIAGLTDPDGALADARDIALPKAAGAQLHLRDIEKSLALPRHKDALAPESVARLLKELSGRRNPVVSAFAEAHRSIVGIAEWCSTALGADAPDLGALARLLQPFAQAELEGGPAPISAIAPADAQGACAAGAPVAGSGAADTAAAAAASPAPTIPAPASSDALAASPTVAPAATAASMDRWSALAAIQETRIWFEQNEPSSPVIVLLRQSERMVGKRFSELAHVIPAELLAQWDEMDN
ncbi:type VI secretion system ImpA family N-terminal domain-containing protein [Paraburkholderia sp. MMS20-SJTR3]|uniref:Type VI secretion system ImpA family N-terminal domain-containing protein n=1 Tax=Paraburkholderia sejongensis TaxID=2886946 RepID=A0ABS8K1A8_9BURK|nr:type VI secretion system ImpA family N-terminal domain-containing protein [Paraburkholderia sp. MMS20-SJTR3]MCC8395694.1 type VI secretion system ImpA family N-terminal domain-containing protein [Paraburkholderia sp. MMS20-SJTR3]